MMVCETSPTGLVAEGVIELVFPGKLSIEEEPRGIFVLMKGRHILSLSDFKMTS